MAEGVWNKRGLYKVQDGGNGGGEEEKVEPLELDVYGGMLAEAILEGRTDHLVKGGSERAGYADSNAVVLTIMQEAGETSFVQPGRLPIMCARENGLKHSFQGLGISRENVPPWRDKTSRRWWKTYKITYKTCARGVKTYVMLYKINSRE